MAPPLTNLGVARVFRLILPMALAAGGERYLYHTMRPTANVRVEIG
jgi:hypothetical protein